jgi:ATP-binding cassette subfamily B protein
VHSVRHANRIIVMQSCRITGFDTHDNLLKTNDIYREIYTIQTQDSGDFDKV